jgi:cation transport ATPase
VVATPCPLILAVPVAIVSGLSRAARYGILIKGGKAIEALARVYSLVIDKTGTLTDGRARVVSINAAADAMADEVLRIAASLDQASKHIIAQTLVTEAPIENCNLRYQPMCSKRLARGSKELSRVVTWLWAVSTLLNRDWMQEPKIRFKNRKLPALSSSLFPWVEK